MLLRSLTIQGFKSFADKTTLQFGKGITAVVGPNGSGKSNISDAIRWVLGEQSTKTLRGAKMEDVVFGGTAARRPLGFAEVTLTIDNTDRGLQFDNDTVAVTRRYYRSGESEYQLNGVSVRLRDVHELFMDTGLGRDGYSMIGQGRIDSIVGSKSNERRDIFEEAAGISRYRYRKQEAERRLSQAEENLLRLRDILQELEGRVEPLKEQSEKAAKFLEYAEQKKELEIGLWLHMLSSSKDALREQDYKITLAETQYQATEEALKGLEEKMDGVALETQAITVKIEEIRRAAAVLEEEAVRTDGEAAVLENTVFHNGETAERIDRELESLDQSAAAAAENAKARRREAEEKSREIARMNLELANLNAELEGLISHSEGFSRRLEELAGSQNALAAESAEERVKMVTAQSSLNEIEARGRILLNELAGRREEIDGLQAEYAALLKDKKELEEQITACSNALKGYELRKASRSARAEELKAGLEKLRLDIGEKKRRAQILEDLERNMEGFAYSVKAVMKATDGGQLRGVHGPVSRLIKVDKPYATAIEIALGAAMQNIVVDTEEDAKRAIQYLKNQKAGRSTFLPVTSVKGRVLEEPQLTAQPGFVGLAVDLVKCDQKYQGILKSLLGRAAVAENIDAAVAIAKRFGYRFKIVTLDGQVVNAGGSLTGGSLSKNAGLLGRAEDIRRLREQAAGLEKQLGEQTEVHKEALADLAAVEADMSGARGELTTAQEDHIRVEGELRRVGGQKEAAEKAVAVMTAEQAEAGRRTNQLTESVKAAAGRIEELEARQTALQKEMDEAAGGRDSAAGRREELSAAVTALRLRLIEADKDKESIERMALELEAAASGRSGRREELEAEKAALAEKNAGLADQIATLKEKAAGLREQSAASAGEVETLQNQRNEGERQAQSMRQAERDKTSEREKISGELARLTERKNAMLAEYDDIIRRLFDEYELTRSEAEATGIQVEDPAKARVTLNQLKNKIRALGSVNVAAIEEYKEVAERYAFLSEQLADVEKTREELYHLIERLTGDMRRMFTEGFDKIAANFTTVFKELFGGGTAELRLTDPDHVLDSGIDILVQPPGKKVSSIELLSGGEKALIAVSIYFAIMKVNPPPFCMMDEVETALDDINVDRFAEYMKRMTGSTQFICISHRRGTMEAADMLYGVTMQEKGVSKLLSLNVSELAEKLNLDER